MMDCKLMSLFRAVHCDDDRYLKAEQLAITQSVCDKKQSDF